VSSVVFWLVLTRPRGEELMKYRDFEF